MNYEFRIICVIRGLKISPNVKRKTKRNVKLRVKGYNQIIRRIFTLESFPIVSGCSKFFIIKNQYQRNMRLKSHLVLSFLCFVTTCVSAQTPVCKADTVRYRDSISGVYPLPFVAGTRPNGGITTPACIGKAYSFVWTIKLGDTVSIVYNGAPVAAPIDSVTVGTTGAIEGLPVGLSYACNPPNCVFPKKTYGCVVVRGTPTAANMINTYPLKLSGKAYASGIFALFSPFPLTFPGVLAEGSYDVKLYGATDTRCTTSTDDLTEVGNMSAFPNPTNGKTTIRFESTVSDKFEFSVTDLLGRTIQTRPLSIQAGLNTFELDVTSFPNGVYIYNLTKGSRTVSNKLIVNQ